MWDAICNWFADLGDQLYFVFIEKDRYQQMLTGLKNTLLITAGALIVGVVIGVVVASIRSSYDKNKESMKLRKGAGYYVLTVLNAICKVYLTVIRGTPVVVQLMISYFIIFVSAKDGVPVGIFAFGINSGAYVAEIFRSGIMAIDQGQFEASRSLGLTYRQTMMLVILPQAFKNVLPALANEFIVLLKETSISGYIGLNDLTRGGDIIRSITYDPLLPLFGVALIYLVLVVILSQLVKKLERRLRKNER